MVIDNTIPATIGYAFNRNLYYTKMLEGIIDASKTYHNKLLTDVWDVLYGDENDSGQYAYFAEKIKTQYDEELALINSYINKFDTVDDYKNKILSLMPDLSSLVTYIDYQSMADILEDKLSSMLNTLPKESLTVIDASNGLLNELEDNHLYLYDGVTYLKFNGQFEKLGEYDDKYKTTVIHYRALIGLYNSYNGIYNKLNSLDLLYKLPKDDSGKIFEDIYEIIGYDLFDSSKNFFLYERPDGQVFSDTQEKIQLTPLEKNIGLSYSYSDELINSIQQNHNPIIYGKDVKEANANGITIINLHTNETIQVNNPNFQEESMVVSHAVSPATLVDAFNGNISTSNSTLHFEELANLFGELQRYNKKFETFVNKNPNVYSYFDVSPLDCDFKITNRLYRGNPNAIPTKFDLTGIENINKITGFDDFIDNSILYEATKSYFTTDQINYNFTLPNHYLLAKPIRLFHDGQALNLQIDWTNLSRNGNTSYTLAADLPTQQLGKIVSGIDWSQTDSILTINYSDGTNDKVKVNFDRDKLEYREYTTENLNVYTINVSNSKKQDSFKILTGTGNETGPRKKGTKILSIVSDENVDYDGIYSVYTSNNYVSLDNGLIDKYVQIDKVPNYSRTKLTQWLDPKRDDNDELYFIEHLIFDFTKDLHYDLTRKITTSVNEFSMQVMKYDNLITYKCSFDKQNVITISQTFNSTGRKLSKIFYKQTLSETIVKFLFNFSAATYEQWLLDYTDLVNTFNTFLNEFGSDFAVKNNFKEYLYSVDYLNDRLVEIDAINETFNNINKLRNIIETLNNLTVDYYINAQNVYSMYQANKFEQSIICEKILSVNEYFLSELTGLSSVGELDRELANYADVLNSISLKEVMLDYIKLNVDSIFKDWLTSYISNIDDLTLNDAEICFEYFRQDPIYTDIINVSNIFSRDAYLKVKYAYLDNITYNDDPPNNLDTEKVRIFMDKAILYLKDCYSINSEPNHIYLFKEYLGDFFKIITKINAHAFDNWVSDFQTIIQKYEPLSSDFKELLYDYLTNEYLGANQYLGSVKELIASHKDGHIYYSKMDENYLKSEENESTKTVFSIDDLTFEDLKVSIDDLESNFDILLYKYSSEINKGDFFYPQFVDNVDTLRIKSNYSVITHKSKLLNNNYEQRHLILQNGNITRSYSLDINNNQLAYTTERADADKENLISTLNQKQLQSYTRLSPSSYKFEPLRLSITQDNNGENVLYTYQDEVKDYSPYGIFLDKNEIASDEKIEEGTLWIPSEVYLGTQAFIDEENKEFNIIDLNMTAIIVSNGLGLQQQYILNAESVGLLVNNLNSFNVKLAIVIQNGVFTDSEFEKFPVRFMIVEPYSIIKTFKKLYITCIDKTKPIKVTAITLDY